MKDSEDLELQVNANEMCRTCLGQFTSNQLKPIFCNEILDGKIVAFPKIIEATMSIKPVKNGVFPNNVCVTCKTKLKELFSFKEKVTTSQDLLYEIFGIEKPIPPETTQQIPQHLKKEKVNSLVQTDIIRLSEGDEHIYNHFLLIDKPSKPKFRDISTQNAPSLKDTFTQFTPEHHQRHVSIQVAQPAKNLKHAGIQVEIVTEDISKDPQFVENELHDVTEMDLMYEIEENTSFSDKEVTDTENETIEALVVEKNVRVIPHDENEKQLITVTASKSNVKLELELVNENEQDECVAYEALDGVSINSSVTSEPVSTAKYSKYCCRYCQYITDIKTLYDSHNEIHQQSLETVIDSVDYYRCGTCNFVFPTHVDLGKHFESASCSPTNPNELIESEDVEKHEQVYKELDICLPRLKSFRKNDISEVTCGRCSLNFSSLSNAVDHYAATHDEDDDSHQEASVLWESYGFNNIHVCGICHSQFADASFIRQHVYFHRNWFDCPYSCGQSFNDFFKMTVHINRKHLHEKSTNVSAPTSVKREKTIPQSESVCHICFKRFISKASFKVHVKNHFAERRYNCSMCTKAFLQKSDLTIHIRSHTDERPFACTVAGCDKKFRTSSHRRDHMSTHAQEKKYQCDVCQKYFKAERILQGHMRLHSGFKPFECGLCGKCFSRKHHLKLHMKTHDATNE
ncbi:zinc finger protein 37 homolog [Sabethes cyaneus]|uniref:zinc finger protein 37 homolog n=1 Tax=Sabethes cyaneus TaxID=53552 RepID=UPI00237EB5D6|nr:zinc finger protein 37 homolog [Sabethes cyaneus]